MFIETNSIDEASSLGWSLALLARWEGVEFAISVIEKQLWPFLQRWSAGQGTNTGAAAVIIAIGKFSLVLALELLCLYDVNCTNLSYLRNVGKNGAR